MQVRINLESKSGPSRDSGRRMTGQRSRLGAAIAGRAGRGVRCACVATRAAPQGMFRTCGARVSTRVSYGTFTLKPRTHEWEVSGELGTGGHGERVPRGWSTTPDPRGTP